MQLIMTLKNPLKQPQEPQDKYKYMYIHVLWHSKCWKVTMPDQHYPQLTKLECASSYDFRAMKK